MKDKIHLHATVSIKGAYPYMNIDDSFLAIDQLKVVEDSKGDITLRCRASQSNVHIVPFTWMTSKETGEDLWSFLSAVMSNPRTTITYIVEPSDRVELELLTAAL
jgi:hypothetical protein